MANNAALRNQRIRQAIIQSYPAPYGGINTVNALAAMPSQDAVDMVNFFPDVGGVKVRKGYTVFSETTTSEAIKSLHFWDSGSTRRTLAATDSVLFDIDEDTNGYQQIAVQFDGSVYLSRMGTQVAAGGFTFLTSVWLAFDADDDGVAVTLAHATTSGGSTTFKLSKDATNKITVQLGGVTLTSSSSFTSASGWLNVLINFDSFTQEVFQLYINDAPEDSDTATTLTGTPTQLFVGANSSGAEIFSGKMADLWIGSPPIGTDLANAATRRYFIDANGKPVNRGSDGSISGVVAASQVNVWNRGDAADFLIDNGEGAGEVTYTQNGGSIATAGDSASGVITASANGRWQSVNFNKLLFLCNGSDTPKTYDGTTFTNSTISGPTVANIIGCNVYRNRLYVWEDDSQSVWYGATNTIGGTFTEFPLGRVGKTGGKLIAMGTLTYDGGEGADDVAVFIMSTGEILIYQGPDPSQFAIIGIFRIGKPLGIRALDKVGPDLLVATNEDYVSLTEVLRDRGKVRSKISGAARDAATLYAENEGWQVVYHPKDSMVLVNIPTSATTFEQHVQNTLTGAWTKYNDIDAFCWAVSDGNLYFGGANGVIYQAETGNTDNGTEISATAQTAWYPSPVNMQAVGFTPYFITSTAVDYTLETAFDYGDPGNAQTLSFVPGADNDRLLAGQGKAISHKITTSSNVSLGWASYDTRFRKGSQV